MLQVAPWRRGTDTLLLQLQAAQMLELPSGRPAQEEDGRGRPLDHWRPRFGDSVQGERAADAGRAEGETVCAHSLSWGQNHPHQRPLRPQTQVVCPLVLGKSSRSQGMGSQITQPGNRTALLTEKEIRWSALAVKLQCRGRGALQGRTRHAGKRRNQFVHVSSIFTGLLPEIR